MKDITAVYRDAIKRRKQVLMPSPEVAADAPAHAPLGCSSADRWMVCAGAPQMEAHFEDETSSFAAEGTCAHAVREQCLTTGKNVEVFVGDKLQADGFEFAVEPYWVGAIQPGIDRVRDEIGLLFVEYRVDLSAWIEGEFGTLDTGLITKDEVILDDFKFGRGVIVDAERNRQMMLYAAGFYENVVRHIENAPTRYRLRIDQPRVPGRGSEWVTTLDEILKFAELAASRAVMTRDPDAKLTPSMKGCAFCRAASNVACPAYADFALDLVGLTVNDLDKPRSEAPNMPVPEKLSPERRSYIIEHGKMLTKYINNLHGDALGDAQKGHPVPGFKAVATQGDRAWKDEAQAEEFWSSKMPAKDIFNKKLKSPAQMEIIAGTRNWTKAQELIHRPEGKPALVPESDPRPALIPMTNLLDDLDDDFDLLDDLLGVDPDDLI